MIIIIINTIYYRTHSKKHWQHYSYHVIKSGHGMGVTHYSSWLAMAKNVSVPAGSVSFTVGESFESYNSLMEKIQCYEAERFVQLIHRDSRTLEMAKK